jgi:hypothetical protein
MLSGFHRQTHKNETFLDFMFEDRALRRIFGPKRKEVARGWRTQHNEELHNLYDSPDIVRMIKCKRMRWARHVARMGKRRSSYKILNTKPDEKMPPWKT